ncbi:MAG: cysteine--tRNA ligase [Acidobacteriota bacterium]
MLKLRNTLSGQVEEFLPLNPPSVGMYVCGPTVYDYAHIGNFRTFLFADLLRRYLRYKGYRVHHVMNVTDIEDKIIARAAAEGSGLRDYTDRFVEFFLEDFAALGAEQPEEILRATDHIDEMVELIQALDRRGHTYQSGGSTYFRISTFPAYGKLSKIKLDGNLAGGSERIDADEYSKEDARDFVLWKASKDGEPSWSTQLGNGRPGWHIECSAMSMKALGKTFDIHVGGADLVFPHHENEIAQSEGATGEPFVRYWIHAEFLMVEGEKMSKSKGNYYTFRDLVGLGHTARAIRYQLLSAPHHRQFNFTMEGLRGAEGTVARLLDFRQRLSEVEAEAGDTADLQSLAVRAEEAFASAMDDDLNTAEALAAIHTFVRETRAALDRGAIRDGDKNMLLALVDRFDAVFGVFGEVKQELLDSEIQALIDERQASRARRNFARADEIRQQLSSLGIVLEDTKEGVRWRRPAEALRSP